MSEIEGLQTSAEGVTRCGWSGDKDDYRRYHDTEWGRPTADDRTLFQKICLEGFQSGLSWLTILRKRGNFQLSFDNFEIDKVAIYDDRDIARLLDDAGIVRHHGKIVSTINNAKRAIELREEYGSLATFVWSFEPDPANRPAMMNHAAAKQLSLTAESTALSKALKKRGWSFVGPTTCYAFMQAMGMVNDHLEGCAMRAEIEALRVAFVRP
jgi:DNA-3-methyladenine glycosylase I